MSETKTREALRQVSKLAREADTTRARAWLKVADIATEAELAKLRELLL